MRRVFAMAAGIVAVLALANPAAAAGTVVVDSSGDAGWSFNPDPTTVTAYEMTTAVADIGAGSLHVLPIINKAVDGITTDNKDKFVAALSLGGVPISDYEAFSFDFQMENTGTNPTPYKQFYVNVYTNLPSSTTFYDCRFDYVAASGSTSSFSTLAIAPGTAPTAKGDRADAFSCPATAGQMPSGSSISAITVNVGDTGANDLGIGGYLDDARLTVSGDTTTYDFEAPPPPGPASKDDCKAGGWVGFGFPNQGACIASLQANERAGK